ncbi:hypothetical protein J4410_00345 [Candidatus Woesearchaeota archaeon]|nr:hypothetical protein [Candidatus Woesearchaeota archaeon]
MKQIPIVLKRIEVTQFVPAKGAAHVSLWFQHTAPHMMQWWITPGDKDAYVEKIMKEIKQFVKTFHPTEFHGDDVNDILASHSIIVFDKQDETEEKLNMFIGKLLEKLKAFHSTKTSEGYIGKVISFEKMGIDF